MKSRLLVLAAVVVSSAAFAQSNPFQQAAGQSAPASSAAPPAAATIAPTTDPLPNIQGQWLGSSGDATRPSPFEFSVSGRRVYVTAHRDKMFRHIAPVGALQAELIGDPPMTPLSDGQIRSYQFTGKCYDGNLRRMIPCKIQVNHNGTYHGAPRDSWTITLSNFDKSTVYRESHLAKLRQSYSPNFQGWE